MHASVLFFVFVLIPYVFRLLKFLVLRDMSEVWWYVTFTSSVVWGVWFVWRWE